MSKIKLLLDVVEDMRRLADSIQAVAEAIDTLVDLKRDIMRRIKSIPSTEYQLILEKRYLCFMQWEQIAVAMGYSIQHIYRLHDRALNEFPVPDER